MYARYLIQRVRNAPSKLWNDWKVWRNHPTMEYRDVHNILPGSYLWRFPAPGSEKIEEDYCPQWFEKDYKTAYKNSPHYIRRIRPKVDPPKQKYFNFPIDEDIKKPLLNLIEDSKNQTTDANAVLDINSLELDQLKEKAESYVKGIFEFSDIACKTFETSERHTSIEDHYLIFTDNYGGDRSLDTADGNPFWQTLYLDGLQYLYNYDDKLRDFNDYKMDVYHGRTKAWQVLPDTFPKDQVDKVQASLSAPVSDQLDEWEAENNNIKMQMPINNDNLHKVRDAPDHHENLDHDYERIVYERQHKQMFEQMRNSRYEELLKKYYKNTYSH